MPQLNGVKTVSGDVIEYAGFRYEKTDEEAVEGDIVRSGTHYSFMPKGAFYLVDSRGMIFDEDGDAQDVVADDGDDDTLFRRTSAISIANTLAAKRAELERLSDEIAELEARLAEESRPKVGDYARIISADDDGYFIEGDIVKVSKISADRCRAYPIDVVSAVNNFTESSFGLDDLERLTSTEARAALIAQVNAIFDGKEAAPKSE